MPVDGNEGLDDVLKRLRTAAEAPPPVGYPASEGLQENTPRLAASQPEQFARARANIDLLRSYNQKLAERQRLQEVKNLLEQHFKLAEVLQDTEEVVAGRPDLQANDDYMNDLGALRASAQGADAAARAKFSLAEDEQLTKGLLTKTTEDLDQVDQDLQALDQNPAMATLIFQEDAGRQMIRFIEEARSDLNSYHTHDHYQRTVGREAISPDIHLRLFTIAKKYGLESLIQESDAPFTVAEMEQLERRWISSNLVAESMWLIENEKQVEQEKKQVEYKLAEKVPEISQYFTVRWNGRESHSNEDNEVRKEAQKWLVEKMVKVLLDGSKTKADVEQKAKGITDFLEDKSFKIFYVEGLGRSTDATPPFYIGKTDRGDGPKQMTSEAAALTLFLPQRKLVSGFVRDIKQLAQNNPAFLRTHWKVINMFVAAVEEDQKKRTRPDSTPLATEPAYYQDLDEHDRKEVIPLLSPGGKVPYTPDGLSEQVRGEYLLEWEQFQKELAERLESVQATAEQQQQKYVEELKKYLADVKEKEEALAELAKLPQAIAEHKRNQADLERAHKTHMSNPARNTLLNRKLEQQHTDTARRYIDSVAKLREEIKAFEQREGELEKFKYKEIPLPSKLRGLTTHLRTPEAIKALVETLDQQHFV